MKNKTNVVNPMYIYCSITLNLKYKCTIINLYGKYVKIEIQISVNLNVYS